MSRLEKNTFHYDCRPGSREVAMNFGLLLVAVLVAAPAQPAKTLTVDEIVAKSIEARGGSAKIAAIQSLRVTGKLVFGGGNFSVEAAFGMVMKRPGMIRSEPPQQGLTAG